jgi:hypothetical protein
VYSCLPRVFVSSMQTIVPTTARNENPNHSMLSRLRKLVGQTNTGGRFRESCYLHKAVPYLAIALVPNTPTPAFLQCDDTQYRGVTRQQHFSPHRHINSNPCLHNLNQSQLISNILDHHRSNLNQSHTPCHQPALTQLPLLT